MKQVFLTLSILMILTTSKNAGAQKVNATAFNASDVQKTYLFLTDDGSLPKVDAATVNVKALKDFSKSFKNAVGEKWYSVSDGFIANFSQDGIETKVAYNKKGKWHSTLLTYDGTKLPSDVRDLVKSTYNNFSILVAYEIHLDNNLVYILKLEDKKTLKTLRITDGEIEVISDNIKG